MPKARTESDLNRAFAEDGPLKTHVGGQALLGGIMMRGKYNWSVAVREPDGSIYTEEHDLASGRRKNSWMHWPVVRGCRAFVESLALSYKASGIAAEHAFAEFAEDAGGEPSSSSTPASIACAGAGDAALADMPASPSTTPCADVPDASGISDAGGAPAVSKETPSTKAGKRSGDGGFGGKEVTISLVIGLILGVVLFVVLPAFLANAIVGEYDAHTFAWNIVDGIVRVAIFVFYIWLIGHMKDVRDMFGYHGAEHKTIHCFEHGLPLTAENARSFPRLHVRCGTAFLIMVMIIAIIVYTLTPLNALISAWGVSDGAPKLALVIVVRILLMPLIAGLSYEITVKWAGSHPDNPLVKVILWPGMQMQYLTTNEPDDGQIECAIAAMRLVLEREEREEGAAHAS